MAMALMAGLLTLFGQVSTPTPDVLCGAKCLHVALKAFGLAPATFEEIERRLGPPGARGYSLAQLDDLAKVRGAKTIAVETTVENLARRGERFACIALLEPAHFVLLYDIDDRQAWIIDPPKTYTLPLDVLRRTWTRKALLIGPAPFLPEEQIRAPFRLGFFVWGGVVALLAGLAVVLVRRRTRLRPTATVAAACLGLMTSGCRDASPLPVGPLASSVATGHEGAHLTINPQMHDLGDVVRGESNPTREIVTPSPTRGAHR